MTDTERKAHTDAGILTATLAELSILIDRASEHISRATTEYSERHGNEEPLIASHLRWALDDLAAMSGVIVDVQARTGSTR